MNKTKVCPFMTAGLISAKGFTVDEKTMRINFVHTIDCFKKDCELWDKSRRCCGLKNNKRGEKQ